MTSFGEVCDKENPYIDTALIAEKEKYDVFYAVCTNLDAINVDEVVRINKKR